MMTLAWICLGAVATIPLLWIARRTSSRLLIHLYGTSLLIAAIIYIGFALVWGDANWLLLELLGVLLYGGFYWLALQHSLLWLAAGWLLHPLWDLALHLMGPGAHLVPDWYAVACVSFDVIVAGFIALQSKRINRLHSKLS